MTDSFDEIEIFLRDKKVIADRMTILFANSQRLAMENDAESLSDDDQYDADTARFDLRSWIRTYYSTEITDDEYSLLGEPVGELPEQLVEDHEFDSESALALGWVLGLVPDLPMTTPTVESIRAIQGLAPKPWDRPDKLSKSINLRSEEVVWTARDGWYLVRLRGFADDLDDMGERQALIDDVLTDADESDIPTGQGDLLIDGEPFAELNDEERQILLGTTEAYVKALTWACGLGESWTDVPIDDV